MTQRPAGTPSIYISETILTIKRIDIRGQRGFIGTLRLGNSVAYNLAVSTIFGVNVGAEFMPKPVVEQMDKDALWGFLLDLFILRIMYIKLTS